MSCRSEPTDPNSGANPRRRCDSTTEECPLCDATVSIGRVQRGNPYVPRNVTSGGMPDSVPPSKTYEVEITVTWSKSSCPGQYIDLSIINGSADNGTATVSPTQITKTTKVTVKGLTQTKPGNGSKLKIQAKLDGNTVKAESAGFTVCAHPLNWRNTYHGDINTPTKVGVAVQDDWDSDSGTFSDLDETEISEVVEYTGTNDNPPFPARGAVTPHNSGYLPGNQKTVDSHSFSRAQIQKGPAGKSEAQQLSIFKCKRCGAVDKTQPNSGLKRVHEVYQDGSTWKHRTKKVGAKVKIGAYETEAGNANVTSSEHTL